MTRMTAAHGIYMIRMLLDRNYIMLIDAAQAFHWVYSKKTAPAYWATVVSRAETCVLGGGWLPESSERGIMDAILAEMVDSLR